MMTAPDRPEAKQEVTGSELTEKGTLMVAPRQPAAIPISYRKTP